MNPKPPAEDPGLFASVNVVSVNKLLSMQQDQSKLWMNRIYFSPYCRAFYVLLILLNIACIVWTLFQFGSFPTETWFLAIEVSLSAMVKGEVGWRMYLQGCKKFWTSVSNIFDVLVSVACFIALGFAAADTAVFVEGFSGEVVLVFRTAVQYLRLVLFIKNQRKAQATLLQMINFSELAEAQPKPEAPRHVLVEEEEKSSNVPNNTGTAHGGDSEDRTKQPRTLMIPNRA